MKKIITIMFICLLNNMKSQDYGTINGLAVDLGFDKAIEDARRRNENLQSVYIQRYKNLKNKYDYGLSKNSLAETPKLNPYNGVYEAVITNTYDIMEVVFVECVNGLIASVTANKNTAKVINSTTIENFRAVVKGSNEKRFEIIFTDILY